MMAKLWHVVQWNPCCCKLIIIEGSPSGHPNFGMRAGEGSTNILSLGLIDIHMHISALGGCEWEGYGSATKVATA
jgi:dihydroorotase-like cyclic amidohydrolase